MDTPKRKRGRQTGFMPVSLARMQSMLDFIKAYEKTNHIAPTLKEITKAVAESENSFGYIQKMIQHLISEGFLINNGKGSPRSLVVNPKPPRRFFYKASVEDK